MLFNPFKKGGGGKKKSSLERILDRLVDMDPNSANCTLIKTPDGLELDEDLERAAIFKYEDRVLIQNKAFYISTPDGIKAEDKSLFTGKGEILNLWFLYNQIPHSVDCRVMGRIRFAEELLPELTPRIPVGYMLKPVGNIRKNEKRQFLRYTHKVGYGSRKVYTQVRFDLYVSKTEFTFPDTGGLPPYITELPVEPYTNNDELVGQTPEQTVKFMKNAVRLNSREARVVYVGKPFMDERTNKVSLLEMGNSDVLGLETSHEDARTFYIRKPPNMDSDRRSPLNLKDGDTVVLGFHTRVSASAPAEYYDMVSQVTRIGTENMTVRTGGVVRKELGLPVDLFDFSIGGIKMACSKDFLRYTLGEDHQTRKLEDKIEALMSACYLLNFYPKTQFGRETLQYEPDLPMKIQILGKIVWCETTRAREEERSELRAFGMKFYYDPEDYSRDTYSYDRWSLIRDFKENKYFREVHNSLNQLIGFLESQNR